MQCSKFMVATLLLAIPFAAHAELTERQVKLLVNNCLQCHVQQDSGAPFMGKREDWVERNRLGEEGLLRNVIQGLRGMPPFGLCSACDENDLRALTRQLSGLKGEK